MSVTFYCPESPTHIVHCECMAGSIPDTLSADEQDAFVKSMSWQDKNDWGCKKCDYMAGMERSEGPELNFSNSNAADILRMLNIEFDDCGTIQVRDLPALAQRVLLVKNSDGRRARYTCDPYQDDNIYEGGVSDDSIVRRLEGLDRLIIYAIEHGYDITWG